MSTCTHTDTQVIIDTLAAEIILLVFTPYCYLSIINTNNPLVDLAACFALSTSIIFTNCNLYDYLLHCTFHDHLVGYCTVPNHKSLCGEHAGYCPSDIEA